MPILVDKKWKAKQLVPLLKRPNVTIAMRARKAVLRSFKKQGRREHLLKPQDFEGHARYANANTLAFRPLPTQTSKIPSEFTANFFRRLGFDVYRTRVRKGKSNLHNEAYSFAADARRCEQRLSMRQKFEHFHLPKWSPQAIQCSIARTPTIFSR